MKKKILYGLLTALLLVTLVISLASCDQLQGLIGGEEEVPQYPSLSGVSFEGATFTYDGKAKNIAISGTLPAGVSTEYVGNGKVNAGDHTVVVRFYYEGELMEGYDKVATLRINKASSTAIAEGLSFPSASFEYDGAPKSLSVFGNLPSGITVEYEGNGVVEVGEYTVTASFVIENENYYPIEDMQATLTITEATEHEPSVDLSGISFEGATYTYDGEEKSLAISGTLPEGVTVEYTNNGKTDAGSYVVEADFFYEGVELTEQSMRAKLVIEKATVDLSGISFEGATVIFDGEAHSLKIEGTLPDFVTVEYINNAQTLPGTYTVTAKLDAGKNYVTPADMQATLKILSYISDLSGITLGADTVVYDGEAHSLAVAGTLPEGITVEYVGNERTEVGTYTVTAKLYYYGVYVDGADLSATLKITKNIINMSGISFEGKSFEYDGEAKSLAISGTLPTGVSVEYIGNEQIAAGEYTVIARFTVADTEHYEAIPDMTAKLSITRGDVDLSGISLPGGSFTYDGLNHGLEISGTLPEGIEVRYFGNVEKNAGVYTVIAKFYNYGTYIEGADLGATMVINKATYDMSDISFENGYFVRSGEAYSIFIAGKLPGGVSVSYTGNGQSGTGRYTVTASFAVADPDNYNAIPDMTADIVIEPKPEDLFGVLFEDVTVICDGSKHSIYISGAPLAYGVTVTYEGNGQTEIGVHTVVAKFYIDGEYIEGADKTAILTIEHPNPLLSHIVFEGATFTADGAPKSIFISGELPEGYTVVYKGENGKSVPGTYTVTAKFFGPDGVLVEHASMKATYTIEAVKLPAIAVEDLTVPFDGNLHEILIPAVELPDGIEIIRIGEAAYMPGVYKFTFRYKADPAIAELYDLGEDVTVRLTINSYADDYATEGLIFGTVSGGVAVIGYEGTALTVVIPSTYEGKAVKAIAATAFRDNKTVKRVIVPDSVTAIAQGAFRGTELEEIKLPFIGGSTTSSNKYLGYIFGASAYGANEYYVPVTLKKVILSDACKLIPAYSFRGCVSLEEVVIGSGVTEIGISAFEKCESLGSIYIPDNVTDIPAAANYYNSPFFGCDSEFTIYLEVRVLPTTGYGAVWSLVAEGKSASIVLGVSYEDYQTIKNSN